ncbi:MAG TPA: BPL-N domain-containing protein [Thermoplasmata archaeon]|nr:BPL-N domain-containing protein [Thermoplasmata archaeon]
MSDETVLVYVGKGSSHSWIWLAELLEARGMMAASFVDAAGFVRVLEDTPSLAVISGGDGFEIASSLSGLGFDALREFIGRGGRYIGICAGAYLPLPSRVEPFSELNLSTTRIMNIRGDATTAEPSPRLSVRYGSCSVFHPVRGEVVIGNGADTLIAPVYGGPIFSEPTADLPVLRYLSFTQQTTLQVESDVAEEVMIGQPAVLECNYGDGRLTLAGPHLEHPEYPEANDCFMRLAGLSGGKGRLRQSPARARSDASTLGRSLADLKVAVMGMERATFITGAKQWDGSRMLELAAAVERWKWSLDGDASQAVSILLDQSRESLMSLGPDKISDSDSAPGLLVEAARLTVDRHFRVARDGFILADNH